MKTERKQAGWAFWIMWIVATGVGMFLGFLAGFYLGSATHDTFGDQATHAVFGITMGLGVGLLQWFVLRRRVSGAGWWIPTNAVACWGLVSTLLFFASGGFSRSEILMGAGAMALFGAVTGTLQWFVLRKKVPQTGWWIWVTAGCWGVCMPLVTTSPFGDGDTNLMYSLVTVLAILGAVTGGVMIRLLRKPVPVH